jgi:hypothetical protein
MTPNLFLEHLIGHSGSILPLKGFAFIFDIEVPNQRSRLSASLAAMTSHGDGASISNTF